ncbi:hypothetical protein [Marinomonas rhizomae]|uniref:Uncharacterized protein n=1 Tax=Marinomonas rhizomae TaxID=491948 RepID=A0A366J6D3_9GAMM|nr:hypothetical protein [Marinomonas rhizomae]RBP82482.1 hypothetical protein DFP80_108128 [Marinomonas rhizomae]
MFKFSHKKQVVRKSKEISDAVVIKNAASKINGVSGGAILEITSFVWRR